MSYTIEIEQDEDVESPRTSCDNLGRMICFHERYNLGDAHEYKSNDYSGWEEMEQKLTLAEDAVVILPLYLYDHSGITVSTSPFYCSWDSGQIGFILASREAVLDAQARKHVTNKLRARVEEVLRAEVRVYDQYLTGDVWGYQIADDEGEVIDSCWGFYGREYAEEQASKTVLLLMEEPPKLGLTKEEASKKALDAFIATVTATGGVYIDQKGLMCPVGAPKWIDLGEAYRKGCHALGYEMLTVPDPDEGTDIS